MTVLQKEQRWASAREMGDHLICHVRSAQVDDELDQTLTTDLIRALPSLKMADYFAIKPDIFRGSEHVSASIDRDGHVDGAIVVDWRRTVDGTPFAHIVTAFVGEAEQGTDLVWRMWAVLWDAVAAARECPSLIAFRTYNPRSFRALGGFAGIEGAEFYPQIPADEARAQPLAELAGAVADVLSPGLPLVPGTGVVRGGGGAVPADFYPTLHLTATGDVNEHFRYQVDPADRVLCMLRLGTEASRARFMEASSTGRGPRAV